MGFGGLGFGAAPGEAAWKRLTGSTLNAVDTAVAAITPRGTDGPWRIVARIMGWDTVDLLANYYWRQFMGRTAGGLVIVQNTFPIPSDYESADVGWNVSGLAGGAQFEFHVVGDGVHQVDWEILYQVDAP